jgi:hypothetical protein
MARQPYETQQDDVDREASALAGEEHLNAAQSGLVVRWLVVLIPLAYGIFTTIEKSLALFQW